MVLNDRFPENCVPGIGLKLPLAKGPFAPLTPSHTPLGVFPVYPAFPKVKPSLRKSLINLTGAVQRVGFSLTSEGHTCNVVLL